MPAPTAQELLDATKEAILKILQGHQSADVNGRLYRKADLSELRALRAELETEVRADAGQRIRSRRAFLRG